MSTTITKKDVVKVFAKAVNLKQKDSMILVDGLFWSMRKIIMGMEVGDRIEIRGFGSFSVRKTSPLTRAYSPSLKKQVMVPPHRKLKFKPSKEIIEEYRIVNPRRKGKV